MKRRKEHKNQPTLNQKSICSNTIKEILALRKLVKTLAYLIQENPDDGNKDVKLPFAILSGERSHSSQWRMLR